MTQAKVNPNMRKMVSSVQELHSTAKTTRDKNKYLSLVAPHFSRPFLRSIGFKFSSSSFANARRQEKIYEKRHYTPPSKQPISLEKKRKINEFLIENSTIASNKTKKIKLSEYLTFFQGNIKINNVILYNKIYFLNLNLC
jgi:hypothetical protein